MNHLLEHKNIFELALPAISDGYPVCLQQKVICDLSDVDLCSCFSNTY